MLGSSLQLITDEICKINILASLSLFETPLRYACTLLDTNLVQFLRFLLSEGTVHLLVFTNIAASACDFAMLPKVLGV